MKYFIAFFVCFVIGVILFRKLNVICNEMNLKLSLFCLILECSCCWIIYILRWINNKQDFFYQQYQYQLVSVWTTMKITTRKFLHTCRNFWIERCNCVNTNHPCMAMKYMSIVEVYTVQKNYHVQWNTTNLVIIS